MLSYAFLPFHMCLCCLAVALHESTGWAESINDALVLMEEVASGILTVLYNLTAELFYTDNACKHLKLKAYKEAKTLVGSTPSDRHAAASEAHEGPMAYWLGGSQRESTAPQVTAR